MSQDALTLRLVNAIGREFYYGQQEPNTLITPWEELDTADRDAFCDAGMNYLNAARTAREMSLLGRIRQLEGRIANALL